MDIYIKSQNNQIIDFSLERKDNYDRYLLTDKDFFMNTNFYTVKSGRLALKEEYKKLEENEFLVMKNGDEKLVIAKPFIEHIDNVFITLTNSDEDNEILRNIGNYYSIVDGQLVIDEERKQSFLIESKKDFFREYRAECFDKWDIEKTNALIDLADPITDDDKSWYIAMCEFPDYVTENTYSSDWPDTPERFKP